MRVVFASVVVFVILAGALTAWSTLYSGDTVAGSQAKDPPAKPAEAKEPPKDVKRVNISKNVDLEIAGDDRRVIVQTTVCLRQGQLEQLLTRAKTKEHESVLVADLDAREIHKALLLARAEPGSPVKFQPKFTPPTGTPIKITAEYQVNGKTVRRPAQDFIRDVKTKKPLASDWVFGGSKLFQDPFKAKAPPWYMANDGNVICIANFDDAMLDVPFDSTKENEQLNYEANPDAIPALETPVTLILEPILKKK